MCMGPLSKCACLDSEERCFIIYNNILFINRHQKKGMQTLQFNVIVFLSDELKLINKTCNQLSIPLLIQYLTVRQP